MRWCASTGHIDAKSCELHAETIRVSETDREPSVVRDADDVVVFREVLDVAFALPKFVPQSARRWVYDLVEWDDELEAP